MTESPPFPSEDDIRLAAYYIWEAEGRPHGRHLDNWSEARDRLIEAARAISVPTAIEAPRPAADPGLQTAVGVLFTATILATATVAAGLSLLMPHGNPARIAIGTRGPRTHWRAGRVVAGSRPF